MSASETVKSKLRFGAYLVDLQAGELYKRGKRVNLQQQPMQILAVLLEHPREVVTREQLRERIWPADTFVDFEHSLNTAVKKLRQALGDNPNRPKYVETIPRRGYRFLGRVEASDERVQTISPSKKVGKVFTLQVDENATCVVAPADEKCLEEWQRLKSLSDDVGVSMMIAEQRLLLLEGGNSVRLLSSEESPGWCQARILEGEHYGKVALVPKKALKPAPKQ